MKALGIVRKIDQLGRIVIPMEVGRTQKWEHGTLVEMFATDDGITMRKYQESEKVHQVIVGLEEAKLKAKDVDTIQSLQAAMEYLNTKLQ
ncbi:MULTISPECIES: AbrB/MazE/SpoVT family DNA-binding domain-containing protein [Sporosarcina]|nr:AbrB/MazE/SpoVT family DNA-binding domain-containing protein [Sporosarcina aquimarina]MBY0222323.1 AbrB family transcriptional regulator [Sporosarcina aquimarina]